MRPWSPGLAVATAGRHDLAPGIYGTIISGSVLAAVDDGQSVWTVAFAMFVTVLVYWLAERYSELLAAHVRAELITIGEIKRAARVGWPMVEATYTPVLVLAAVGLLGGGTPAAVTVALFYTAGLLVALGWVAGRRNGQSGLALVATVAFAGGLGIVMVLLKFALH